MGFIFKEGYHLQEAIVSGVATLDLRALEAEVERVNSCLRSINGAFDAYDGRLKGVEQQVDSMLESNNWKTIQSIASLCNENRRLQDRIEAAETRATIQSDLIRRLLIKLNVEVPRLD